MNIYISLELLNKIAVVIVFAYVMYMTILLGGFRNGKKELPDSVIRVAVILIALGPLAVIYLVGYTFICI